jgi:hypothetical protein
MPCMAWALKGGTHCYFHANPEKVSELGRRGGEAKGPGGARYAERSLKTVDDVTALLGDTIKDLGNRHQCCASTLPHAVKAA